MAANPLTQFLGPRPGKTGNNPLAMLTELRKFAQGMTPQRAEQEINRLMQSGQMSQQQFEALKAQAEEIMQYLK